MIGFIIFLARPLQTVSRLWVRKATRKGALRPRHEMLKAKPDRPDAPGPLICPCRCRRLS